MDKWTLTSDKWTLTNDKLANLASSGWKWN